MIHTKTLVAGPYQTSALPSLAAFGSGGAVGASACAVAYVSRTRDGREMYITVVSSATWNSHTRAYMHSSQITEIQQIGLAKALHAMPPRRLPTRRIQPSLSRVLIVL